MNLSANKDYLSSQKLTSPQDNWTYYLKTAIRSNKTLLQILNLPTNKSIADTQSDFPVFAPKTLITRIKKGDLNDPILKQILAVPEENDPPSQPNYKEDPLEEKSFTKVAGLIHKYHNRALIITHTKCAINCRFCFRRHFPYANHTLTREHLKKILLFLDKHQQINEVILSGGDPLMLHDEKLDTLIQALLSIKHVKRIRIHTRLPVVIPQRVNKAFLALCKKYHDNLILVTHINHSQEIDSHVQEKIFCIKNHHVLCLNQSVLLRGINDCPKVLSTLSEKLFDTGILPYYLHIPDPVSGTEHFNVSEKEAQSIHLSLQAQLSGYLVPKLVQERPNYPHKTLIPVT